jgi:hypothetical protein
MGIANSSHRSVPVIADPGANSGLSTTLILAACPIPGATMPANDVRSHSYCTAVAVCGIVDVGVRLASVRRLVACTPFCSGWPAS